MEMVFKFDCPYCCDSVFNSKESLIKHLSRYINLLCPLCRCSFGDIPTLIKHLYICTPKSSITQVLNPEETEYTYESEYDINNPENHTSSKELVLNDDKAAGIGVTDTNGDTQQSILESSKVFLKTEITETPCSIPLTFIHEDGIKKFVIVNRDGSNLNNQKLIQKQNAEETILINTVKANTQIFEDEDDNDNVNMHETEVYSDPGSHTPDPAETEPQQQQIPVYNENDEQQYLIVKDSNKLMIINSSQDPEINNFEDGAVAISDMDLDSATEDFYSCNTCGISFTSVYDHIKAFHDDQDVVVEINSANKEEQTTESVTEEPPVPEKSPVKNSFTLRSQRVITDTGKIVEAVVTKPEKTINKQALNRLTMKVVREKCLKEEELVDSNGRKYTRRIVKIGKFWNHLKQQADKEVFSIPTNADPSVCHHAVESTFQTDKDEIQLYHCIPCNIYVKCLEDFRTRPCKVLQYSCTVCKLTYDNAKSLSAHMKVHKVKKLPKTLKSVQNDKNIYLCNVCGTEFATNKSLRLHVRMHDPVNGTNRDTCPTLIKKESKILNNDNVLATTNDSGSRPLEPPVDSTAEATDTFLCSECHKHIPTDYRAVHEEFHASTTNYHCDLCNRKFQSQEYLDMHMGVHNVEKPPPPAAQKPLPYTCMYCPRKFTRPHEKVKHERIHTGEKPHTCEICGKSFRVSYCLTLHMRTHTGDRPYECPHCGKRFKAHSVYNHHMMTHSDVRAYKCPFCPKSFKTSVQLAGHKNSHTKPFSCTICNRPFASLYAVRVHTETHQKQNNLKYSCTVCGAIYARTFALKDHIRQSHPEKADEKVETLIQTEWEVLKNDNSDRPLAERLKIKVPKILNSFIVKQE